MNNKFFLSTGERLAELCSILNCGRPSILAGIPDISCANAPRPALELAQRLQHHLDKRRFVEDNDSCFGSNSRSSSRATVIIMDRAMDLAAAVTYDLALQVGVERAFIRREKVTGGKSYCGRRYSITFAAISARQEKDREINM